MVATAGRAASGATCLNPSNRSPPIAAHSCPSSRDDAEQRGLHHLHRHHGDCLGRKPGAGAVHALPRLPPQQQALAVPGHGGGVGGGEAGGGRQGGRGQVGGKYYWCL